MTIETPTPSPLPPRECVNDIHAGSAQELLDQLSPTAAQWDKKPNAWIYRGHADATWGLKPTEGRIPLAEFERLGIERHPMNPHVDERRILYKRVLDLFAEGLDRSGLPMPMANPTRERQGTKAKSAAEAGASLPFVALAQHHGIPTELLDWTRRSWVAAYFAAVGAAEAITQPLPHQRAAPAYLAVWALRRGDTLATAHELMFYEAPAATNPNLFAQAGLFTFLRGLQDEGLSLEEHFQRIHGSPEGGLELRRYTLATGHAPELLRLLALHGITGASMFPGADGVVRAMRERALWDSRE